MINHYSTLKLETDNWNHMLYTLGDIVAEKL